MRVEQMKLPASDGGDETVTFVALDDVVEALRKNALVRDAGGFSVPVNWNVAADFVATLAKNQEQGRG